MGWGYNQYGELGTGPSYAATPVPIPMPTGTGRIAVTASSSGYGFADCSFAISANGTLLAWGSNRYQQLGIGPVPAQTPYPTVVNGIADVVAVAAGTTYTVALRGDGTVWTWGDNQTGAFGDNSPLSATRATPQQIPGSLLSNIRAIAGGDNFCLALDDKGHVYSWGMDALGELGAGFADHFGNPIYQLAPAVIANLSNVTCIDASNAKSIAVRSNGTVWGWGRNFYYDLGIGNANYVGVPVQVPGIANAVAAAIGQYSGTAIRADGTTAVWGKNHEGTLGIPNPAQAITPVVGPVFNPNTRLLAESMVAEPVGTSTVVKSWGRSFLLGYVPSTPGPYGSSYTPTVPTNLCPVMAPPSSAPCRHRYQHNSSASTYTASQFMPAGAQPYQPYDIGDVSQMTTLNAGGGTITFDGVYHVRGPLNLTNGRFVLRPGTVFYVEPRSLYRAFARAANIPPCVNSFNTQVVAGYTQLVVRTGATLELTGATLTSSCDEMWGGVGLAEGGSLLAQAAVLGKRSRNCEISHARVGVLVDGCYRGGQYSLTSTNFLNNSYGFVTFANSVPGTSAQGISNCFFSSDPAQRLKPDNSSAAAPNGRYTEVGMLLSGPLHQNLRYSGNTFSGLSVGVEAGGDGVELSSNIFQQCYTSAIQVKSNNPVLAGIGFRLNQLTLSFNTIFVPAGLAPGGQINPATAATGIALLGQLAPGGTLTLRNNRVQGDGEPGAPHRRLIGLDGYLNFTATQIWNLNRFSDLDEGVRLLDASGRYLAGTVVQNNLFERCAKGIVLPGQNAALLSPVIGCNTLVDVDHGIEIEPGARVGNFGSSGAPVSNDYRGAWTETVHNDGALYRSTYWYNLSSANGNTEAKFTANTNPGINYQQSQLGYSCSGTNGLHRQTNVSGMTIEEMQKYILYQLGSDLDNHLMEQQLVRAYEDAGSLKGLRKFVQLLPLQNAPAFGRLSICLMEYYREQQQEDQAAEVATELLTQLGDDPDIANRVSYFEVAGRLAALTGTLPDADDIERLTSISSSGTSFAPVACATLRYYFPNQSCETKSAGIATQNRRVSANALLARHQAPTGVRVQATPNPAQQLVQISVTTADKPLASVPGSFQLVALTTGNVVLSQPLPASGELELNLTAVPAGIYVGRVAGEVNAACKIVVVH